MSRHKFVAPHLFFLVVKGTNHFDYFLFLLYFLLYIFDSFISFCGRFLGIGRFALFLSEKRHVVYKYTCCIIRKHCTYNYHKFNDKFMSFEYLFRIMCDYIVLYPFLYVCLSGWYKFVICYTSMKCK